MEASLADQDSIHSSSASQTNLTSSKPVSYRESQFNKILGAPVVKLPELRNLGWNGIPVSDCDDDCSAGPWTVAAFFFVSCHCTSTYPVSLCILCPLLARI
jgi:hypothetical protein